MTSARKSIEEIIGVLRRESRDPAQLSRLSSDYAALCRDLNSRLAQIEEVLDGGDDRQALLMAERPPSVMDEADTLSFSQLDQWSRLCEEMGLPPSLEIHTSTVHRLNAVYGKGIQPSHGIYKEFRAAVLSRDDETALRLARTIEKANPTDEHANKERARLEQKVLQNRLKKLREALQSSDEPTIESALAAVREFGSVVESGFAPVVPQAEERLQVWRAQAASVRCREWLKLTAGLETTNQWQRVGELLDRIDEAIREHTLAFSTEEQEVLQRAREYFGKSHQEFQTQREFESALKQLLIETDRIESMCQASGIISIGTLTDLLTSLNRLWQKVQSFGRPVEDATIQKVGKLVEFLRTEITRAQKKRLITVLSSLVMTIAIACAAGWWLLGLYRANEATREIASAVESNLVTGVEKLSSSAEAGGLVKFSAKLAKQIEEGRAWVTEKTASEAIVRDSLTNLEASVKQNFTNEDPLTIRNKAKSIADSISALPKEYQGELRQRLAAVEGPLGEWVRNQGNAEVAQMRTQVETFEKDLLEQLKVEQGLPEFTQMLNNAEKAVLKWAQVNSLVAESELPPDLRVAAATAKEFVEKLRKELDSFTAKLEEMRSASAPEEYQTAMGHAGESSLVQLREVQALRLMALLKPDVGALNAELIFPWNPDAWKAVLKGGESEELYPSEITASENTGVSKIINDEFSSGIYAAEVNGRPNRRVYTKGADLQKGTKSVYRNYETQDVPIWSGNTYDPSKDGDTILFRQRSFGPAESDSNRVSEVKILGKSAPSKQFDAMRPEDLLNNIQVKLSIWELLDRLNGAGIQSPMFEAFVAQNLKKTVAVRPFAWGGHFSPSGSAFLENLVQATDGRSIKSGDWFRADQPSDTIKKIESLLTQKTQFKQEALMNQFLARSLKRVGGLKYAGFVGPDGKPIVSNKVTLPDTLWGMAGAAPDQKASLLFSLQSSEGTSFEFVANAKAAAYTPLFYFPGDRKQILKQAREAASVSDEDVKALKLSPLFAPQ